MKNKQKTIVNEQRPTSLSAQVAATVFVKQGRLFFIDDCLSDEGAR